jgi:hypothetical protein
VETARHWGAVLTIDVPGITDEEVFRITSRANLIGGAESEAFKRVAAAGTLSALRAEILAACSLGGEWMVLRARSAQRVLGAWEEDEADDGDNAGSRVPSPW